MVGLKQGSTLKSGKYKIVKTLGQGSFGITYLATTRISMDGQLGKMDVNVNVTIKEFFMSDFNSRAADGTSVERTNSTLVKNYLCKFQREAENLSKLHHPNIVKVLEVFDENNTTYYVMEFIDGETIDEYIKRNGILSVKESLHITNEVCKALSYMHDHKMLHLDLKPKNIMRDSEGHIYLIDFGLAKQYNDNGEPESSTTLGLGTPGYAPIEQAHYKKDGTFPVTLDIYAVGASLYKMLTGKTPPESSYVLNDGLPHDALTKVGVNDNVIAVVEKAMAPIKKDRYQTVTDLSKAIFMLLSNDELPKTEDEEEGTTIDTDSGERDKVEIDPNIDEIEFHFIGSSYPGSRSYETHITDKTISLKISCYGDILLEEAFPFNKLRFSKLIETIKNLDIHKIPKFDEGATGGETLSLILHRGGAEYYSGYIYGNEYNHFGGTTDANLYLIKSEIEKCIPNFQTLLFKEKSEKLEDSEEKTSVLKKYRWVFSLLIVLAVLIPISWIIYSNVSSKARVEKETSAYKEVLETKDTLIIKNYLSEFKDASKEHRAKAKHQYEVLKAVDYIDNHMVNIPKGSAPNYGIYYRYVHGDDWIWYKVGKGTGGSVSSFKLFQYEMTNKIWKIIMGDDGLKKNDNKPVNASYEDCLKFIEKLNNLSGKKYRLPTIPEWLSAASPDSGKKISELGWFRETGHSLHDVGMKSPNAYGLYDMIGNVHEWCQERFDINKSETQVTSAINGKYAAECGGQFDGHINSFPYFSGAEIDWTLNNNGVTGFRIARDN